MYCITEEFRFCAWIDSILIKDPILLCFSNTAPGWTGFGKQLMVSKGTHITADTAAIP